MRLFVPFVVLVVGLMLAWPAGQALAAADDVPGTPLAVDGNVSGSVDGVDANDVYAVELIAGQEAYIRCDPGNSFTGTGIVHLLVPGAATIAERESFAEISYTVMGGTPYVDKHGGYFYYMPAVSGTHHLWVERTTGVVDYKLSVARTDREALNLAIDTDDLPGTAVGPGAMTGVVSTLADPVDVYAVTLTAGQVATIQVAPLTPFDNYFPARARVSLLDPNTTSFELAAGHFAVGPIDLVAAKTASERRTALIRYTPTQSGTYYVWVQAGPFTDPSADDYYGMNLAYTLSTSGNSPVSGSGGFSDVSGTLYETAILDLSGRGIINGFEDGTFRPDAPVTRQQFAKMIVKTLGYAVTGSEVCPFTDVVTQIGSDPFYPSKYVAVCALRGITAGKTATTFAPAENITHQQLITMVARAAALSEPPAALAVTFEPGQFSLAEHYENARKAAYAGLLQGLQGLGPSYDFGAAATRGECAQLLYNLLRE